MRQGLIFIFILFIFSVTMPGKEVQSEKKQEMIPDEAIRLRILANSDSEADQNIKYEVRDEVNQYISSLVDQMTNIEDARATVRKELPNIEQIVLETIEREGMDNDFHVEYGSNVNFPEKTYGPYVYPAGEYEAVKITIGEGKGANWWCVLFPPLCYVDVSDDTSDEENEDGQPGDNDLQNEEDSFDDEDTDNDDNENIDENQSEEDVETSFFLLEWLDWS